MLLDDYMKEQIQMEYEMVEGVLNKQDIVIHCEKDSNIEIYQGGVDTNFRNFEEGF